MMSAQHHHVRRLTERLLTRFAEEGRDVIETYPGKRQSVGDYLEAIDRSQTIAEYTEAFTSRPATMIVTTHSDVITHLQEREGALGKQCAAMLFVPGVGSVGVRVDGSDDSTIDQIVASVMRLLRKRRSDVPACCSEADATSRAVACRACGSPSCRKCVYDQLTATGKNSFECPRCGTRRDIRAIVADMECGVAVTKCVQFNQVIMDALVRLDVFTSCVIMWRPLSEQQSASVTTILANRDADAKRLTLYSGRPGEVFDENIFEDSSLMLVGDPRGSVGLAFLMGRNGVVEVEDMFPLMLLVVRMDAKNAGGQDAGADPKNAGALGAKARGAT